MTVSSRDSGPFALQISEGGLSVQSIGLRGRFHHTIHVEATRCLKNLCKEDKRFQLPKADAVVLPLRSNANAKLITEGALHDIALDSILTGQSQWFQTMEAAVAEMRGMKIDVITISTEGFVPRSIINKFNSGSVASKLPGGTPEPKFDPITPELLNGSGGRPNTSSNSSIHLTPQTEGDLITSDAVTSGSAIAVVGMACRYPEADSLEKFWNLISSGGCAVKPIPEDRFNASGLRRDPKGPFWGNFLHDADAFDNRFFRISAREAKSMDPQQRLLLQVAYEALESSGYCGLPPEERPDDIGCYVGVGSVDYGDNVASQDATAFSATGTLRAFISGKVSHEFGWTGPSITYDTACSSSAVAIHSACKVSIQLPIQTPSIEKLAR